MFCKPWRIASALALTLTAVLLAGTQVWGQSETQNATGFMENNPGNPGVDWIAPGNIVGSPDDNCAATPDSPGGSWIETSFGAYAIPMGQTVTGVEVRVKYHTSGSNQAQLTIGGSLVGVTRVVPLFFEGPSNCNSTRYVSAGGAGDVWGLSEASLRAAATAGTLGFRLTQTNGPTLDIDSVELIVYHTVPNSPPVAVCQDVTVSADASCQANVTAGQVDGGSSDPDSDPLTFSLSPPGPYPLGATIVTLTVTDDGGASDSCSATVTVEDNTPPVISLTGGALTLECSVDTFVDPGSSATDNCDGSVPVTVGGDTVDTSTPGVYTITYDAMDAAGNAATQRTRTVTVQDTMPPVISLIGDAVVTLECGVDSYTEPGATAVDACDGSFPATVGGETVDAGTPGTYTVTYDATDGAGNAADQVSRTVTVEDTLPPVISCGAPDTIIPPDAPISFAAAAEDACAGSVTASITDYDCFWTSPAGKLVDKTKSCVVSFSGDVVTIDDSGGVGDTIEWGATAEDGNGNTGTETCSVEVVNPSSVKASNFLHFPQFGSGDGFVSQLVLQNPSETKTVSGYVRFLNPEGGSLEVGLIRFDDEETFLSAHVVEFSLAPLGSLTLSAEGEPEMQQGSVTVGSDGELGGLIRFTVPELGTTTVTAADPADTAVVAVRRTETVDTGIAVRNTEEGEVTLQLSLHDEQGLEVAGGLAVRRLAPGARLALFLEELFPEAETAGFRGEVLIRALEGSFVAVALEVGTRPGEFTALPMTPVRQE